MNYNLAQRRRVQRVHSDRSLRVKRIDEGLRTPLAKIAETMAELALYCRRIWSLSPTK